MKAIRKLCKVTISGTQKEKGMSNFVVLDENGCGTKHQATQKEIDNWFREMYQDEKPEERTK